MRGWMLAGLMLLVALQSTPARAQLLSAGQRCQNDALPADLAELRLDWMRRCSLQMHVQNPGLGYGIGVASSNNAGELIEYSEWDFNSNFVGLNSYTGTAYSYDINTAYVENLYTRGPTQQVIDANGFNRWERSASLKRSRPMYPIYGIAYDISSPSNTQLFPHPTLNGCQLYSDKTGTTAASPFYVNAFCEALPITTLSNGVALGALSDAVNARKYYALNVPAGAGKLTFEVSGGTGEVDLYVKSGKSPTLSDYDCRPLLAGNTESCTFNNPSPGTWYVMLHARSGYSGAALMGQYPVVNVDTAGCLANVAINNAIAQSFRVSSASTLDKLEIWMKPELYYTTSYLVELYAGEGTSGTRLANSPTLTLGSQTGGVPSTWYSFSFRGQGLVLQPNQPYTFKLVRLSSYSGAFAQCGNVYPNGIQYWLGYSPDYPYDVAFRLYTGS